MGRMKEIARLLEEGNSVYEIARIMKIDVNVISILAAYDALEDYPKKDNVLMPEKKSLSCLVDLFKEEE